jgi:hypothetical protein
MYLIKLSQTEWNNSEQDKMPKPGMRLGFKGQDTAQQFQSAKMSELGIWTNQTLLNALGHWETVPR